MIKFKKLVAKRSCVLCLKKSLSAAVCDLQMIRVVLHAAMLSSIEAYLPWKPQVCDDMMIYD